MRIKKAIVPVNQEKGLNYSDIPNGWTPEGWIVELRRKAACCEKLRPDLAETYRKWTDAIEVKHG